MRILIPGGFGFVGGRIAQKLAESGHQIILGSGKERGPPVWIADARIEKMDWFNSAALEKSLNGIDIIVQCAGVNAADSSMDPVGSFKFNGLATTELAWAANRAGVKCFIYLSTAHVYSSPLSGVIDEKTTPSNLHPYAASHLMGETGLFSVCQMSGMQAIVLRLANAYGAPVNKEVNCWNLLVNELCKQAVMGGQLMLNTSGQQERNFIGLDQVCNVVDYVISERNRMLPNEIFNVGSLSSSSVLEMAKVIQQRCSKVIGLYPSLEINNAQSRLAPETLDYSIKKLVEMGFRSQQYSNYSEIDALLEFVKDNFEV
jgi:UDP-glucose 4-epimerase